MLDLAQGFQGIAATAAALFTFSILSCSPNARPSAPKAMTPASILSSVGLALAALAACGSSATPSYEIQRPSARGVGNGTFFLPASSFNIFQCFTVCVSIMRLALFGSPGVLPLTAFAMASAVAMSTLTKSLNPLLPSTDATASLHVQWK